MDRKSKIWQIVLLVLLILAIVAVLFFNNKLNASNESLTSTLARLTAEDQNSASLKADLDTAKAAIQQGSRHYAKRQLTWLRAEKDLLWAESGAEIEAFFAGQAEED